MSDTTGMVFDANGATITPQGAGEMFFPLFDEALNAGKGFTCIGGRLQCGIDELDSQAMSIECLTGLGEHCFAAWQDARGERIGSSEFLDNGADVFDQVALDLFKGKADKLFNCGEAFPNLEVGPGLLTVIGAPPGRGKTAMAMQVLYDAVTNEDGLQAVVASLEVTTKTLIQRRIAMLIGVDFDAVRFNTLTTFQRKQVAQLSDFKETLQQIGFLKRERSGLGDLESLLAERSKPGLLLMDYVQLFGSEDANAQDRGAQTMKTARQFCDAGWAVIAVSAVNRMSYQKSEIGSFRDTSAIEYSGTSAYMLDEAEEYPSDEHKPPIRPMKLRCVKNRNGQPKSIDVMFNGPQMLFSPNEVDLSGFAMANEHEGDFDEWNAGLDPEHNTQGAAW